MHRNTLRYCYTLIYEVLKKYFSNIEVIYEYDPKHKKSTPTCFVFTIKNCGDDIILFWRLLADELTALEYGFLRSVVEFSVVQRHLECGRED